ncbi:hypothetical protein LIER_43212 [Lithospermum erythrorhizon]|uniref:Uncharacterized protein n=1 Tax=Lithospermum erythrorhizon TaxID=34254 RepID=A0AAV3PPM5_LITER
MSSLGVKSSSSLKIIQDFSDGALIQRSYARFLRGSAPSSKVRHYFTQWPSSHTQNKGRFTITLAWIRKNFRPILSFLNSTYSHPSKAAANLNATSFLKNLSFNPPKCIQNKQSQNLIWTWSTFLPHSSINTKWLSKHHGPPPVIRCFSSTEGKKCRIECPALETLNPLQFQAFDMVIIKFWMLMKPSLCERTLAKALASHSTIPSARSSSSRWMGRSSH